MVDSLLVGRDVGAGCDQTQSSIIAGHYKPKTLVCRFEGECWRDSLRPLAQILDIILIHCDTFLFWWELSEVWSCESYSMAFTVTRSQPSWTSLWVCTHVKQHAPTLSLTTTKEWISFGCSSETWRIKASEHEAVLVACDGPTPYTDSWCCWFFSSHLPQQ